MEDKVWATVLLISFPCVLDFFSCFYPDLLSPFRTVVRSVFWSLPSYITEKFCCRLSMNSNSISVFAVWWLVQVLSVDFGGKEWVDALSLRQLPDEVAHLPPFAICCQLADIQPVNDNGRDRGDWSPRATDYLINTTDGKLLTAWLSDLLQIGATVRYVFIAFTAWLLCRVRSLLW